MESSQRVGRSRCGLALPLERTFGGKESIVACAGSSALSVVYPLNTAVTGMKGWNPHGMKRSRLRVISAVLGASAASHKRLHPSTPAISGPPLFRFRQSQRNCPTKRVGFVIFLARAGVSRTVIISGRSASASCSSHTETKSGVSCFAASAAIPEKAGERNIYAANSTYPSCSGSIRAGPALSLIWNAAFSPRASRHKTVTRMYRAVNGRDTVSCILYIQRARGTCLLQAKYPRRAIIWPSEEPPRRYFVS